MSVPGSSCGIFTVLFQVLAVLLLHLCSHLLVLQQLQQARTWARHVKAIQCMQTPNSGHDKQAAAAAFDGGGISGGFGGGGDMVYFAGAVL
jgi:hypothetical protein